MPSNLMIHPTKRFKSSRLALPPSPFSPRFPLSPPPAPKGPNTHTRRTSLSKALTDKPLDFPIPPSAEPLHWLWQCHLCNRVYRLGTTRRCLEDGHFFCSGTTVKRGRRGRGGAVKRHKACASEFDYAGWKVWGVWRRECGRLQDEEGSAWSDDSSDDAGGEGDVPRPLFAVEEGRWFAGAWRTTTKTMAAGGKQQGEGLFTAKDCWNSCDYPSECRWGKQYGVATPTLPPPPPVPPKDTKPKTKFGDILLAIPENPSTSTADSSSETDANGDVSMQSPPLSPEFPSSPEEPTRKPSFDDLLESVKRRKRRSAGAVVETPSPLSSHPPSPTTLSMAETMDLAGAADHVEDVAHTTTTTPALVVATAMSGEAVNVATTTALQRAFDDFDLDFRRSFEKAGAALTGFVSAVRSSAALEEEKAEKFVRDLRARSPSRREREGKRRVEGRQG